MTKRKPLGATTATSDRRPKAEAKMSSAHPLPPPLASQTGAFGIVHQPSGARRCTKPWRTIRNPVVAQKRMEKRTMTITAEQKLDNLANALAQMGLEMTDEEILEEALEEFGSVEAVEA